MSPRLKQQVIGAHLRELRTRRGLSVRELATATGFSPSFISQVENGQASPSISSMERIAEAVGVTMGEFFAAAAAGEGGHVQRVHERQVLESEWSNATLEPLGVGGAALDPILITLGAGGRSGKHPYGHATEEFAIVLEGEVDITLGPETHHLHAGDVVTILPGEVRAWRNEGQAPARILLVAARRPSPLRPVLLNRPARNGGLWRPPLQAKGARWDQGREPGSRASVALGPTAGPGGASVTVQSLPSRMYILRCSSPLRGRAPLRPKTPIWLPVSSTARSRSTPRESATAGPCVWYVATSFGVGRGENP
jgi:transcriptional regulator with XRE-family HTH domain